MKLLKVFLSSIIIYVGSALHLAASAAEEVAVRAGQKTRVYQYAVYEQQHVCAHNYYPKVKDRKTKHGMITSSRGSFIIPSGTCKGKRIKSTDIYYTPDPGFRGVESVRIAITYPKYDHQGLGNTSKIVRFKFNVK